MGTIKPLRRLPNTRRVVSKHTLYLQESPRNSIKKLNYSNYNKQWELYLLLYQPLIYHIIYTDIFSEALLSYYQTSSCLSYHWKYVFLYDLLGVLLSYGLFWYIPSKKYTPCNHTWEVKSSGLYSWSLMALQSWRNSAYSRETCSV